MGYIDYHTHILPGIDDGARNTDSSIRMMNIMRTQDVDCVICTPHFYRLQESVDSFIERRKSALNRFLQEWKNEGYEDEELPQMILGAEVYMDQNLPYMEDLPKLAIEGTNLILLEMPFYGYRKWIGETIYNIYARFKLRPVIAHVDRYIDLFSEEDYEELFELKEAIFQINVDSFEYKENIAFFLEMVKRHFPVVFGSDCHNSRYRKPNISEKLPLLDKPLKKAKISKEAMDLSLRYSRDFPTSSILVK